MRILALNFGSSTLKYALFAGTGEEPATAGNAALPSAAAALELVRQHLAGAEVDAVAHRVVHGGSRHTVAAPFSAETEREVQELLSLAPRHNKLALAGLRGARAAWPEAAQVAVFDTAFHASMPPRAATYAVPAAWREAGVRRYGFHGLSHQHVLESVARRLGTQREAPRVISCHLGNGASVCAIQGGRSIDTSMGFTPLEGLVMGTRCGDLDPGAIPYVASRLGISLQAIEQALHAESGLAALAGHGGDMRRIEAAAAQGDAAAQFALEAYAYRVLKYIGAYAAAMGGCEAVAFTGGVGEGSPTVRGRVGERLAFLGLHLAARANASPQFDAAGVAEIQESGSSGRLLVVRAREEWVMARETRRILVEAS